MIVRIKDKLRGNRELIEDILNKIGCTYIKYCNNADISKRRYAFGRDEESSGMANTLYTETLKYTSFSHNVHGDIITLVSDFLDLSIGEAIKWLGRQLNISYNYEDIKIKLPFNGFFKKYENIQDYSEEPPLTYSSSILKKYDYGVSKLFIDDGIDAITQEHFNIGYDVLENRITIPWKDEQGNLVGIMGRINKSIMTDEDKKYKYVPIIPFRKSSVLYGFHENYKSILNTNIIIIAESEKSCLKAHQMGLNNVVALGGNIIHPRQINLVKSLFCDVIVALDEGIEKEHFIEQAKKCKLENPFITNNIYILNMNMQENPLITEKKTAIFDYNYDIVKEALCKYLIKID